MGDKVDDNKKSNDSNNKSGNTSTSQDKQLTDMLGSFLGSQNFEQEDKGDDKKGDKTGSNDGKNSDGEGEGDEDDEGKGSLEGDEGDGDDEGDDEGDEGSNGSEGDGWEGDNGGAANDGTDDKDKTIVQLQEQLAALSQQVSALLNNQTGSGEDQQSKQVTEEEFFKEDLENATKIVDSEVFKDDAAFDEVFDKREKMNEALTRVQQTSIQAMLRAIPGIINKVIPQYVQLYQKTMDFYKANEDLKPHTKFVGQVTNDIISKNPQYSMDDLFKELGDEVRKRLGLKKKAEDKGKQEQQQRRPAFGKTGGVRQQRGQQERLTGVDKEIDSMLKYIDV